MARLSHILLVGSLVISTGCLEERSANEVPFGCQHDRDCPSGHCDTTSGVCLVGEVPPHMDGIIGGTGGMSVLSGGATAHQGSVNAGTPGGGGLNGAGMPLAGRPLGGMTSRGVATGGTASGGTASGGMASGGMASGGMASGGMVAGAEVPNCEDGERNGTETDIDCGGDCGPCDPDKQCIVGADCISGVCTNRVCREPKCSDEVQNGTETDIDCGGGCDGCLDDKVCVNDVDCVSRVCLDNRCVAAACDDNVKNGGESHVDCGGPCAPCPDGKPCNDPGDCSSGVCGGDDVMIEMAVLLCAEPTCQDRVKNGAELDVDCGGGCGLCADGLACVEGPDCVSGVCADGRCQVSCFNGQQDEGETDVDCGGTCQPCAVDEGCMSGADCVSGVCSERGCRAATCFDGVKNGFETGVDCGGQGDCGRCLINKPCQVKGDCEEGLECGVDKRCLNLSLCEAEPFEIVDGVECNPNDDSAWPAGSECNDECRLTYMCNRQGLADCSSHVRPSAQLSNDQMNSEFGSSLSVSSSEAGTLIAVGARFFEDSYPQIDAVNGEGRLRTVRTGAAYVYQFGPDGAFVSGDEPIPSYNEDWPGEYAFGDNDQFGYAVCVNTNFVSVGGYRYDTKRGAVLVSSVQDLGVLRESWLIQSSAEADASIHMGISVACNHSLLFGVGAYQASEQDSGGRFDLWRLVNDGADPFFELIGSLREEGTLWFGARSAMNTNHLVVGAEASSMNGQTARGRAFVYAVGQENGNINADGFFRAVQESMQELEIPAAKANQRDRFGSAVAIDENNQILVGAYNDASFGLVPYSNENGANRGVAHFGNGAVHYYSLIDGRFTHGQKLMADLPIPGENFGYSVAIRGNLAVVGAPAWGLNAYGEQVVDGMNGAAYVFEFDVDTARWIQIARLSAQPLRNGGSDLFGLAVALTADHILVGAPKAQSATGAEAGLVYVYEIDRLTNVGRHRCREGGDVCAYIAEP